MYKNKQKRTGRAKSEFMRRCWLRARVAALLLLGGVRVSWASSSALRLVPARTSLYPVYWNVNGWNGYTPEGSAKLPVAISTFGFMPQNLTTTGGGCTIAGCRSCNHSYDCEPHPCPKEYWRGCWQGDMPYIHNDGTVQNGGVPQAANLSRHLSLLRQGISMWIPDPDWPGNAMLDFESWNPVYAMNSGSTCSYQGLCYQDLSIKLVRAAHPSWSAARVAKEAESQFNQAALAFMVQTLRTCRELRPKAKWGYYGNFYGAQYPRALQEAMSMFNPQLYLYGDSPSNRSADHRKRRLEIAQIVAGAVNVSRQLEADGLARPLVLPVGWQLYPGASPHPRLDASDLASELLEPYNQGADGLILWGDDPADAAYWDFVANTSGPMLREFERKVQTCADAKCSGHGRCTNVPIEALFTCSLGNVCVPATAGHHASGHVSGRGVPSMAECEGACGPLAKGLGQYFRCTGLGECVPSLQGVSAGECATMCPGTAGKHGVGATKVCECRPPWGGASCATKASGGG